MPNCERPYLPLQPTPDEGGADTPMDLQILE
jgi:hypothetical protein